MFYMQDKDDKESFILFTVTGLSETDHLSVLFPMAFGPRLHVMFIVQRGNQVGAFLYLMEGLNSNTFEFLFPMAFGPINT